ncbi:MAG: hypothetical protein HQL70_01105 [Magnetococcales bacterium]|nr:hypothetical protein [Magnetococcales bacterium]
MKQQIQPLRIGLIIAMLTILFGMGMGVLFGMYEDGVKGWIKDGIAQHQELHDEKSFSKIWRYSQRSHFHAMGLGATTTALILVVGISSMRRKLKKTASILISLGGLYPLSWFCMFLLAPSMGRGEAHHAFITSLFAHVGVTSMFIGICMLMANLVFAMGQEAE